MMEDARPSAWRTVGAQKRWLRSLLPRPVTHVRLSRVPKKPLPAGAVPAAALTCADGSLPLPVRRAAELGASGFCRRLHRRPTSRARLRALRGQPPSPSPRCCTEPSRRRLRPVRAPRHAGWGLGPRPGRRGAGREAEARASASRSRTRRSRGLGGHEGHSSGALRR